MFNIHSTELILIAIVALIVIGPEKLPGTIRTASLWIGRFRRSFYRVKADIERELNADEIRRQLHNESVMADIEEAKKQVRKAAEGTKGSINTIVNSDDFDPGASAQTDKQKTVSEDDTADTADADTLSAEEQIESAKDEIAQVSQDVKATRDKLYGTGKNPKLAQSDDPPDDD